jgi:stage IV sporulation protein FB
MRDFSSWSINLGKWHGVHFRLHFFFLLFGVFALYLSTRDPGHGLLLYGLMVVGVLFLSVLAHEVAHCAAAFRVGGSADQVVIWPFGGLVQPHVPHEYQHELITALAGPIVNLVICLTLAPVVWFLHQDLGGVLKPLNPRDLIEGSAWIVLLKLTLWLNWVLVLVNCLPAFPLDGGRVLRSILWRWFDYRTAVLVVTWGAKFIAAGLCVVAWCMFGEASSLVPAWVALLLLAMFLFFSAKQEMARLEEQELDEELFNYDFSQGYTSLDRHFDNPRRAGPNPLRRWFENRHRARLQRQQLAEQEEERRVDEILVRLHEAGMNGLSTKDRALLERVSARYRNRQQS